MIELFEKIKSLTGQSNLQKQLNTVTLQYAAKRNLMKIASTQVPSEIKSFDDNDSIANDAADSEDDSYIESGQPIPVSETISKY